MNKYILDGHKLSYHYDRVKDWMDGKKIAPITIDWALTQNCPYKCIYCYSQLQKNPGKKITKDIAINFLSDAKDIGVKATSLVSDGESTIVPFFYDVVSYGKSIGLDMALGTCGYPLKKEKLNELLPNLTYLRFNISAGERDRYSQIHGVPTKYYDKVIDIIKNCVKIKKEQNLSTTIGLQMVLMPAFKDQILPLTELGKDLGVDYFVVKHCSDDEKGSIGVDYSKYKNIYTTLEKAEEYSDENYIVKVKWSKILTGKDRKYTRCYGTPFLLQLSGSGVVAPCGGFFNPKYKKYHIGNIIDTRFKDIWNSPRYDEVMKLLASDKFDARVDCTTLCLQEKVNEFLWDLKNPPEHINFI